jgi:hypothetical protein
MGGAWLGAAALAQRSGRGRGSLGPLLRPAAAALSALEGRLLAGSAEAARVAAATGSVAAGVAATSSVAGVRRGGEGGAAGKEEPRGRAGKEQGGGAGGGGEQRSWWAVRRRKAEPVPEPVEAVEAVAEEQAGGRRPWWRLDRLLRGSAGGAGDDV